MGIGWLQMAGSGQEQWSNKNWLAAQKKMRLDKTDEFIVPISYNIIVYPTDTFTSDK